MNKIRMIDLLNKIANGEEVPELIKYEDKRYFWTGLNYYNDKYDEYLDSHICIEDLEQYIEIIEEDKKINKIRIDYNSINIDRAFEKGTTTFFREKDIEIFQCLSAKINELIDEVNKLKEKE